MHTFAADNELFTKNPLPDFSIKRRVFSFSQVEAVGEKLGH